MGLDRAHTFATVSSHSVVIVLCDRQATIVGRLLATLGDDRRAVSKLFLVQRLEESSRGNYVYVCGHIRISYLFDKYFPAAGGFVPRVEALDPVEARRRTLGIGATCTMTV